MPIVTSVSVADKMESGRVFMVGFTKGMCNMVYGT